MQVETSKIRAYADNVILRIEPRPERTTSGLIELPKNREQNEVGVRTATVLAVGPGHHNHLGKLIPTEVKVGERVLVDTLAGQDYSWDRNAPRHNKPAEWQDGADYRIVREAQIHAVIESGAELNME